MSPTPEELHQAFQEAFNRHDLDAVVALHEPHALVISGAGEVRGTDAIREFYRDVFATRPTIDLQTLGMHVSGDLAMLHGKWILRETSADGRVSHREGRNTETLRRQRDGHWLLVIDNPSVPQD